mmetsp:Transcript_9432/g.23672  ORF Transcript_9432/g.23672 Transcript_9432/m.23672 type:complete len:257 (+) Transcript_9432:515-1285(+)
MIWDPHAAEIAGETLLVLRGHINHIFCVAYSRHSNLIVSGSFDESIRIWDARTGVCHKVIAAHTDPVSAVAFSKDNTTIVSASYDGLIRLWDVQSGNLYKTLVGDENPPVSHARFSPNSLYILAATLDGAIRLWDFGLGYNTPARVVKTYRGHENRRFCIVAAFADANPRAQAVVSGSEDGEIVVWDVQSRKVLQKLVGHGDCVLSVDCHPMVPAIASGAMEKDKTVKVWVQEEVGVREEENAPRSNVTSQRTTQM